jgi:hypothetical protein
MIAQSYSRRVLSFATRNHVVILKALSLAIAAMMREHGMPAAIRASEQAHFDFVENQWHGETDSEAGRCLADSFTEILLIAIGEDAFTAYDVTVERLG